jgi:hypothetical protein
VCCVSSPILRLKIGKCRRVVIMMFPEVKPSSGKVITHFLSTVNLTFADDYLRAPT